MGGDSPTVSNFNCEKLLQIATFGGKTFRRKERLKKLKHFIPIYMMTYKSTWSKLCPPFEKKKVTEDISYNFVRFQKKKISFASAAMRMV